jgi:hypothetical protein
MAGVIWTAPAVDWTNQDDEASTMPMASGQVKVTTLHYRASLTDGTYTASTYGTTPDDQNRVYTLPALEAVPESVVIGWIHQALGDEEVQRIEQGLLDSIESQKNPTDGTVNPGLDSIESQKNPTDGTVNPG